MATTTRIFVPARASSPLALWHLLSLDAPAVASLWTWFLARTRHLVLTPAIPAAMFLAVWILYATDRLLDTYPLRASQTGRALNPLDLEARHLFHHRHRRVFKAGIALAALATAALLPAIPAPILHLYFAEAALLALWFALLHLTRNPGLPKEPMVGLFFAAAAFAPELAGNLPRPAVLLVPASLFAALCTLNCLHIDAWERERALCDMHPLAVLSGTVALTLASLTCARHSAPATAVALSGAVLLLLHRYRRQLSRTHVRAAADLALLTPLLLLPFLR